MGEVALLDLEMFDELREALGGEALRPLLARLFEEGESARRYFQSCPPGDLHAAHLAHQLCGSSATFGALCLGAHLRALEQAIKGGERAAAQELLLGFEPLWLASRAALEEAL